jgi:hypothetical protein
MINLRRIILWIALGAVLLLVVFSIWGAFLGADRAQRFFNSIPLGIYWIAFSLLLAGSFAVFPRLLKIPSLLLIHAGSFLILFGGLYGSQAMHDFLRSHRPDRSVIRSGKMMIYEKETDNRVMIDSDELSFGKDSEGRIGVFTSEDADPEMLSENDPRIGKLPFALKLSDFRIEYYDPPLVLIDSADGKTWEIPAEVGIQRPLDDRGTVTVLETFRNFKLTEENDQMVAYDHPGPESNPAAQLLFRFSDGKEEKRFVFANFPDHGSNNSRFSLRYFRRIRDFISDLEVIQDGRVVITKSIEVNHPLYYGGYFFYQDSYDAGGGRYTILQVTSAQGLAPVFVGFGVLVIGLCWHFWIPRRGGSHGY